LDYKKWLMLIKKGEKRVHIKQNTHLHVCELINILYTTIYNATVLANKTPDDGPLWPKHAVKKKRRILGRE
jgi:hypothetical protein